MNILITGGTGLIGRNLLSRLRKDDKITVVARQSIELVKLKNEFPHIKVIRGNIKHEKFVKKIVKGIHVVYHLAALRAVGIAERHVHDCINTNVIGTMNLLRYFKGSRFVTLSSDKAVQINSVYGATKFLVEKLIFERINKCADDVRYLIIRSGNVFGSKDSVMSVWKQQLQNREEITVTDLNATRYFCTIDQVINSILQSDNECRKIIRCLDLKSTSLKVLLEAMQIKYGKAIKINVIGIQQGENKHEKLKSNGISSDKAKKYTLRELSKLI